MGASVGTEPRVGPRTRSGAARNRWRPKNSLIQSIKQLPAYGRLVYGLITDSRVNTVDKVLLGAAIAYVVSPVNLVPEFIPIIGELDDLFVLAFAIQHLVAGADPEVLAEHWTGDLAELEDLNVKRALLTAALFLPKGLRRRMRVLGRFD